MLLFLNMNETSKSACKLSKNLYNAITGILSK